ncbi:MAG: trypsin-like serine protease [Pseudomonadota bacterium]
MMIRRLLVSLVLLAVPVAAQETNTNLQGLNGANDALVWQAVGRLDAGGKGFCTATLISPEFVLTAAHCVYSKEDASPIAPGDLTFRAGLRHGSVSAERTVAQVEPHPGFRPRAPLDARNIKHDVALLRLAEPISTSVLDPFILHDSRLERGSVSVVSYGLGRAELPSRQRVCQMLGTHEGVVFMDCDVTFGSSGAPVFTHRNGRGQIVSVISGMGSYDGQRVTYGMELPARVAELKHQMRVNASGPVASARRITAGSAGTSAARADGAKFVRPGGS